MYLSKVSLHSTAQAAAELAKLQSNGAYSAHQLLWRLFSENDERNFIFRQEQNTNGLPYFYVLSQIRPRELPSPILDLQTKEFLPKIAVGQRLAFKLRANPTICITDGGKKKRHDVLMHAKKRYEVENLAKSELDFVVNQAAQAWLADEERLERWGVQLALVPNVQAYTQHKTRKAKDKLIQFSSVDFEGVLTVTDPNKFLSQYAKGYGRAKGLGCGLMLIRPV